MLLGSQASMPFTAPVFGEGKAAAASSMRLIKAGVVLILLCAFVFQRFGINVGGYFLEFSLIAQYVMVTCVLFSGAFRFDTVSVMLLAITVVFAVLSYLMNADYASVSSLFLLLTVYFPYVLTLSPKIETEKLWRWTARTFTNVATFIALAGIIQFFAQTVVHQPWLFDFGYLMPPIIRQPEGYNTVYSMGTFIKSNGFFLREPSSLSGLMGLALVFEWTLFRRPVRLATYALALVVSYSGSGILILLIAFLFPLSYKTVLRYIFLGVVGGLILYFLGAALNLSVFVDRASELGSEQSSGYARFVAPFLTLIKLFASDPWTPLVGHGPGMISRVFIHYGAHDPTYAKLLFEYGALGGVSMLIFVAISCRRSPAPVRIKGMFFFTWLVNGGALMTTAGTTMIYIFLAMWPTVHLLTRSNGPLLKKVKP